MLRRQLPVYSPLSLSAVLAGIGGTAADRDHVSGELRRTFGSRQVVLTDSGTHALTLAFRAVHAERPTLSVALPGYCCYDIATAADGAGVKVVLYDVDPHTLGPDFASLSRVAKGGVSAIVVVHLYGVPVDLGEVARVAAEAGAVIIEDAAQGVGGSYAGRPLGAHGSLAILSFGRGKGLTAGRGGALLANDARGAALLERAGIGELEERGGLGEVVPLLAQWLLARPALYGIPASIPWLELGETIYHQPTPPGGLPQFAAGVLRRTLGMAGEESRVRKINVARILEAVRSRRGLSEVRPPTGGGPGYLRLPVTWTGSRGAFQTRGARALGVMPGYPKSLGDLPGFGERWVGSEKLPGARTLATSAFTLATHSKLGEGDLREMERWLEGTVE